MENKLTAKTFCPILSKLSVTYYQEAFKEPVEIEHEATEKAEKIASGSKVKLSGPSGQEAW